MSNIYLFHIYSWIPDGALLCDMQTPAVLNYANIMH